MILSLLCFAAALFCSIKFFLGCACLSASNIKDIKGSTPGQWTFQSDLRAVLCILLLLRTISAELLLLAPRPGARPGLFWNPGVTFGWPLVRPLGTDEDII